MRSLLILVVLGLIMSAAIFGCGTQNGSLNPGSTHETAGLTLNVLPETYLGGADVSDFSLSVQDYGDSLMVDISATNATSLKALYFSLDYDKANLRPMVVDSTDLMGDSDELLRLQVFKEMGVVHYGQVLTHPDLRVGFTGSGVVAQVLFRKEPALNTRLVSLVPDLPISAQLLSSDFSTNLSWLYSNQGDYNQDSEVNLTDLTPVAIHFGEGGPWAVDLEEFVIDGDQNTEINLADITPIAINFQKAAAAFHIYAGADPSDYPAGGALVQILGADGIVPHSDGVQDPGMRRVFNVPVADIDGFDASTMGYWVFPSDGTTLGTISNAEGWNDILPSFIQITNPPAGGLGTVGTPWEANILTDYTFTLTDPIDADVTHAAGTVYIVEPIAAGSIDTLDATLNIEDTFTGTFTVSATYNGIGSEDPPIYMNIPDGPVVGLYIMADSGDADWGGVTGTGVNVSNPYVLGVSGGFNADYLTEFSLVANTQEDGLGDVIPNNTLTWQAFPPFVIDWSPTAGDFSANMFTGEYLFAQDGETNVSNYVYVVHQSLPDS